MASMIQPILISKLSIIQWQGLIANIPTGFQICDGTNGTPDLRAKFVRGAPAGQDAGGTGGSDTITLNTTQIPSHNHGITDPTHVHGSLHIFGGTGATGTNSANTTSGSTSSVAPTITINNDGGGAAHNNIPQYYEVIYIAKVLDR